jgi:hypothetical protein
MHPAMYVSGTLHRLGTRNKAAIIRAVGPIRAEVDPGFNRRIPCGTTRPVVPGE